MTDPLTRLREDLDEVDARLVGALADRQRLVRRAAEAKASSQAEVHDPQREGEMLGRLAELGNRLGLHGPFVASLYREILDFSVRCQGDLLVHERRPGLGPRPVTVAFQGTEGAYSHQAALHHFGPRGRSVEVRGSRTFREMLAEVEQGRCDYAMLPIENTTAGSINEAYDLLAQSALTIVGEEALRVEHCLLGCEQVAPEALRRVGSHPQALAQCSHLLTTLGCEVVAAVDTAVAAREVARAGDPSHGAIASAVAADLYGLEILQRDVANQRANFTRFFVVARSPVDVDPRVPAKISLVFRLPHRHGALARALQALASHGLDLTKLESRPVVNSPWEYLFYADVAGHLTHPETVAALGELADLTSHLRVLGCYPARIGRAQPASHTLTGTASPRRS